MLDGTIASDPSGEGERRKQMGVPEFIEVTQIAILQAADDLGTLTGSGSTPQNLVDQVRASLVVRESDFARAIGMLIANELLDIALENDVWSYALTQSGRDHLMAWIDSVGAISRDWSVTHARTRKQAVQALLASRARHALGETQATRH
ncbi:hypothetical protein [Abyssibacter sp.]|jgi:hypothetical protein|uniref:hypothetical protein n=1 Tax=Abyssibacter sp. TaxID=2320200 RepID=UPI0025BA860E|nr:hypothetical protein [Abyssibacter sp.]MCK5858533.1 hypothetical protein [Abyssibacter sp.]